MYVEQLVCVMRLCWLAASRIGVEIQVLYIHKSSLLETCRG